MAKEITITDDEFLDVSVEIVKKLSSSTLEYFKIGVFISAIAAELFGDEEEEKEEKEKEEEKFTLLYAKEIGVSIYSIFKGGVCKDDIVLMKESILDNKVIYTRRFKTAEKALSTIIDEIA